MNKYKYPDLYNMKRGSKQYKQQLARYQHTCCGMEEHEIRIEEIII